MVSIYSGPNIKTINPTLSRPLIPGCRLLSDNFRSSEVASPASTITALGLSLHKYESNHSSSRFLRGWLVAGDSVGGIQVWNLSVEKEVCDDRTKIGIIASLRSDAATCAPAPLLLFLGELKSGRQLDSSLKCDGYAITCLKIAHLGADRGLVVAGDSAGCLRLWILPNLRQLAQYSCSCDSAVARFLILEPKGAGSSLCESSYGRESVSHPIFGRSQGQRLKVIVQVHERVRCELEEKGMDDAQIEVEDEKVGVIKAITEGR
ncbi:unnamed protein product, partial [Protopolystoma xenopodis]